MGEAAPSALSVDAFYAWVSSQELKYELVDGAPVIMMAGASRRHDRIAANAIRVIGNQLRGKDCQPFTSDTFVAIPAGNRRLPGLGVDRGPFDDDAVEAGDPRLVVEILSPTTRAFDRSEKLEEYKTVESLDYILLVDPDSPQVRLFRRNADRSWMSNRLAGLDAVLDLPLLSVSLTLAEIYESLSFRPRPTLIGPDDTTPNLSI